MRTLFKGDNNKCRLFSPAINYDFRAYSTLRNETKRNGTLRNGTLRNGTLRNGYNTMLHHTLSRVPRIPLKAEDL